MLHLLFVCLRSSNSSRCHLFGLQGLSFARPPLKGVAPSRGPITEMVWGSVLKESSTRYCRCIHAMINMVKDVFIPRHAVCRNDFSVKRMRMKYAKALLITFAHVLVYEFIGAAKGLHVEANIALTSANTHPHPRLTIICQSSAGTSCVMMHSRCTQLLVVPFKAPLNW